LTNLLNPKRPKLDDMKEANGYLEVEKRNASLLIVEDDQSLNRILESYLREEGYQVKTCLTIPSAEEMIRTESQHIILADLALPPTCDVQDGLRFMKLCLQTVPHTKVVVITGEGTMDTAISCMRQGAEDYLVKPVNLSALSVILERALKHRMLEQHMEALLQKRLEKARLGSILGESFLMQRVFDKVRLAAQRDDNVLVLGESGTGKGVVAQMIHDLSRRRDRAFVKVNCTALYEGLLESELFGHEKGSFTGAVSRKTGKFEYAKGGTLFLDEIGEIPPWIQAKLLHAVEDKEIERIGGNQPIRVDTRIIATTNTNIRTQVEEKQFRLDLYYRLNTVEILLPPLRKRLEDIPLLAEHFVFENNRYHQKGLTLAALEKLMQYDWPGNVRELKSVISRAAGKAPEGGWIEPQHVEIDNDPEDSLQGERAQSLQKQLEAYEKLVIQRTLQRHQGNVSRAAAELDLTRSGLHKKISRLRIHKHMPFS